MKILAIYFQNHTKTKNILCEQTVVFLNAKAGSVCMQA